jgi:hypothetical protein
MSFFLISLIFAVLVGVLHHASLKTKLDHRPRNQPAELAPGWNRASTTSARRPAAGADWGGEGVVADGLAATCCCPSA